LYDRDIYLQLVDRKKYSKLRKFSENLRMKYTALYEYTNKLREATDDIETFDREYAGHPGFSPIKDQNEDEKFEKTSSNR